MDAVYIIIFVPWMDGWMSHELGSFCLLEIDF